jgi:outer membrane protease
MRAANHMWRVRAAAAGLAAVILWPGGAAGAPAAGTGARLAGGHGAGFTLTGWGALGALGGEARESVFTASAAGGARKASELVWDLSSVLLAGAGLDARADRLGLHASAWTGLTGGDGYMEDTDWSVEGSDWTYWSRSSADVTEALLLDLGLSWRLGGPRRAGAVRILAGYRRQSWEWRDSLLEHIYSINGFRDVRGRDNGGLGVRYAQRFDIPYAGVSLAGTRPPLCFEAHVLYSPFVSAEDRDFHVRRGLHFEESFAGGEYIAAGVSTGWALTDRLSLSAALDWQAIPEITGDMRVIEERSYLEDAAGIAHRSTAVSAAARWRL